MGKGENADYQKFLIFPQCFQEGLCFKVVNSLDCAETSSSLPKQPLVFTCLQDKSFEITVGKGEIAHNEQFLLSMVLSTHLGTFFYFHQI